jgi:hypothetical protein
MRARTASAASISLTMACAICLFGAAVLCPAAGAFASSASGFAKDKPLSWKPIEDALLRVNDAPPKEWGAYRTGKKNEPVVLQIGNQFLLIQGPTTGNFPVDHGKPAKYLNDCT